MTLHVLVPERLGWTKKELEAPLFESRFVHETYRQLAFHEGGASRASEGDGRPLGQIGLSLEDGHEATAARREPYTDGPRPLTLLASEPAPAAARIPLELAPQEPAPNLTHEAFAHALREVASDRGGSVGDTPRAAVWEKLSRAIPAPMRLALGFARTVGRMIPRE
jgi:hypothetical protein